MAQPLPDELLSSAVMRTAAFYGLTARMTSRLLFGEPHVCHPQHPKQLPQMSESLMGFKDVSELLCGHTTFLLTAPFLEAHQQRMLWGWMNGNADCIRRHALRVPDGLYERYRYCPSCFEEQEALWGCRAWLRMWQVPACTLCLRHGRPLKELDEPFRDRYGVSRLLLADDVDMRKGRTLKPGPHDELLAQTVRKLLNARARWHPRDGMAEQKRCLAFYEELGGLAAAQAGMARFWGTEWLAERGIHKAADIMKGIRNRSWLSHLILLKSLSPTADLAELLWGPIADNL